MFGARRMAARSVVDYQIVSAQMTSEGFRGADLKVQEEVKQLLAEGWQPLGPAQTSISETEGFQNYVVSQTMVKYDT